MFGTHSRAFAVMPSFISLAINNTIIASGSIDGLLSSHLGTPHLENLAPHPENKEALAGNLKMSTGVITQPSWADRFLSGGEYILQPMFRYRTGADGELVVPGDAYAEIEAIDSKEGVGAIHFAEKLDAIKRVPKSDTMRVGATLPVPWRRAHFLADAEIVRLQRFYCTEFMHADGPESNAMTHGRMDCEYLLQMLEHDAVRVMGFPMRLADGLILPRPGR
jgi:hypothetical protein